MAGPDVVYPDETSSPVLTISSATWSGPGGRLPAIDNINCDTLSAKFTNQFPEILAENIKPEAVSFYGEPGSLQCILALSGTPSSLPSPQIILWQGASLQDAQSALAPWGIIIQEES